MAKHFRRQSCSDVVRHLFTGWLMAASLEYLLLPAGFRSLDGLSGLAAMSLPRLCILTLFFGIGLWLLNCRFSIARWERFGMLTAFVVAATVSLSVNYSLPFLLFCVVLTVILLVYALWGSGKPQPAPTPKKVHWAYPAAVGVLAVGFIIAVSLWTVNRVRTFSTPTFDFTIFSQMFHNMSKSGLPITTVERDGPLSHFAVHVSPIYYLMLPFYCLYPQPATLQVLQAVILASAGIPMWLIGKQHGLGGLGRLLLCALLLLIPTTAGGTSYDLHENCFLLPLILWLMYAVDRKSILLTALFGVLTLMVKEDAAVYVAVAALYLILRTLLSGGKKKLRSLLTGIGLLAGAVVWFLAVTHYLEQQGDGVMTYRYKNFMYDGSDSLLTVIKAVLLCPLKMVFECADPEKNIYLLQTLTPLLFLPLLTRRYERYVLLIPYVLLNLMSDYTYQHNIMFQYNFGSSAFLLYLTAVNIADLKPRWTQVVAGAAAVAVSIGFFCSIIVPKVEYYTDLYTTYKGYYQGLTQVLDQVPEDASVAASTFYTTYLSRREDLYDVRYSSQENLLSCEYVVLRCSATADYKKYTQYGSSGFEGICNFLEDNGYTLHYQHGTVLVIYRRIP